MRHFFRFSCTDQENARPCAKDKGRGAEIQRKVRASPARNQQIQSNLYGGHDVRVHQVPRNGRDSIAILQVRTIFDTQQFEYVQGSKVCGAVHIA